jgi:hypothetical protein
MTCWSNLEHTTSNPDALCRPSGEACQAAKKSSARPYAGIQQGESLCTLPTSSGGVLVITGSRSGAYHLSGQGYAGCCIRTSENAPSSSALAIRLPSRRHRSRVPWVLPRLFSGRLARATRKKSPHVLEAPTLCLRRERQAVPKEGGCGPGDGLLEKPKRSPFRSA